MVVPRDVVAIYNLFKGKDFEENRKKISYLLCCLSTVVTLYGIAPMSVLMKLIERNPSIHMTEEEIKIALLNIPPEYEHCIVVKDTVYSIDLYPNDRGLLSAQGNKEYYIPTLSEIVDFGTNGYNTKSKQAEKLKQFMLKKMDATYQEAMLACGMIQMQITGDCQMQDIFHTLEDLGLVLENGSQLNELMGLIHNLWNNTRMLLNRGFTPNELAVQKRNFMHPLSDTGKVIDFTQVKKSKVYPNDPCPCGSGKKYKNCCKNKG